MGHTLYSSRAQFIFLRRLKEMVGVFPPVSLSLALPLPCALVVLGATHTILHQRFRRTPAAGGRLARRVNVLHKRHQQLPCSRRQYA